MKHVLHSCDREDCFVCQGGLSSCVVCRGAEASLPTDCPGVMMTAEQSDSVYAGTIDYHKGKWWHSVDDRNAPRLSEVQRRVDVWLHACMGPAVAKNLEERYLRVAEEFAELMWACSAPEETMMQIIREVYEKERRNKTTKVGSIPEESADLLICLAAMATAHGFLLQDELRHVLDRNWANIEKIRGKHAQKKFKSTEAIQRTDNGK